MMMSMIMTRVIWAWYCMHNDGTLMIWSFWLWWWLYHLMINKLLSIILRCTVYLSGCRDMERQPNMMVSSSIDVSTYFLWIGYKHRGTMALKLLWEGYFTCDISKMMMIEIDNNYTIMWCTIVIWQWLPWWRTRAEDVIWYDMMIW